MIEELHTKRFYFLGMEREATEKFLHIHVPKAIVTHADQTDGLPFTGRNGVDLHKTPGIPQNLVIAYTTATNIFAGSSAFTARQNDWDNRKQGKRVPLLL